jgi:hypothetical protein
MKYSDSKNLDFVPWQPSTWPDFTFYNDDFLEVIKRIFNETIIAEIDNVIEDAINSIGSIEHRGHVIAIAQLCAIDTLSSYAFFDKNAQRCNMCGMTDSKIRKYTKFIEEYFPDDYKKFGKEIYKLYRNSMVHSWNLFEVAILPDETEPHKNGSNLIYGLLNFQKALKFATDNFLKKLSKDTTLQDNVLMRYSELQKTAKP